MSSSSICATNDEEFNFGGEIIEMMMENGGIDIIVPPRLIWPPGVIWPS